MMEEKLNKLREYDRSLRDDLKRQTQLMMALGEDHDDYIDIKNFYDVTYGQIYALEKVFKILS